MKSIRVTRYRCDFCNFSRSRRDEMGDHERHCFKNPTRIPRDGELSSCRELGDLDDYGYEESIGMAWREWNEKDPPPWFPGVGRIYSTGEWVEVPGHEMRFPTGAHGCAGGPPPEDVWPLVKYGSEMVPLDKVPRAERFAALFFGEEDEGGGLFWGRPR